MGGGRGGVRSISWNERIELSSKWLLPNMQMTLMFEVIDDDGVSTVHAAIIAINEAIDQQVAEETFSALQNPSAMLVSLDSEAMQQLQDQLFTAKQVKAENAKNKVST